MSKQSKTPRVRVPYKSMLEQFDALEIHYDDEHKEYHLCGGNWDPKVGKLVYFRAGMLGYSNLTLARSALKLNWGRDGNGAPIRWEAPET